MKCNMTKKWETDFDSELGTGTLKIEYEFDPGEPRVDYYPDGSGSPGTPPSVTILTMVYVLDEPDIDLAQELQSEILDGETTDENPND
jgi:hypothetical protein